MKRFFKKAYVYLAITAIIFTLNGCKDEEPTGEQAVNRFINDCFEVYYLWNNLLPGVNYKKETDPYTFFNKMKYKDDRWSTLTDDVKAMEESFSGEDTTFGYSLIFYYSEILGYFAVVRYTYPDSPAEKAGLKRGDIILRINGNDINQSNYLKLYYSTALELSLGKFEQDSLILSGRTVSMTAVKTYLSPVIVDKIVDIEGNKIGYLHYTDYLLKSHNELKRVFSEFANANVQNVVLDLRYNGGGYAVTSRFICSMLLAKERLNGNNIYLKQVWNKEYMNYFKKQGEDVNEYFTDIIRYSDGSKDVKETVDVNLGISRIYILTGDNTASASEATIVGLMPYMEVITIGETTHGKYCGGSILSPDIIYNSSGRTQWYNEIRNWGAYIMLYRYANANGYPEHTNGLKPDYVVNEDLINHAYPLGDPAEPLFAKAIELITGIAPVNTSLQQRVLQTSRRADELNVPVQLRGGRMIDIPDNLPYL